jgi:protein-S-isoprenylcysteine O-methyltransferase Ste14
VNVGSVWRLLARRRVALGFASAVWAAWLASPTPQSFGVGMSIAAIGQALRVWAAGHIEKGREVTKSGPYRFMRHPLYVGSSVMGVGFIVASASVIVAVLVAGYLALGLTAAVRTEEADLRARFGTEYDRYSRGETVDGARAFSWTRAWGNREYRSVAGFVALCAWLVGKMLLAR